MFKQDCRNFRIDCRKSGRLSSVGSLRIVELLPSVFPLRIAALLRIAGSLPTIRLLRIAALLSSIEMLRVAGWLPISERWKSISVYIYQVQGRDLESSDVRYQHKDYQTRMMFVIIFNAKQSSQSVMWWCSCRSP